MRSLQSCSSKPHFYLGNPIAALPRQIRCLRGQGSNSSLLLMSVCLQEVRLGSRSGLGDEPLFHVRLGGMYVLRIHLAMMNGAGRLPLIVEGVQEVSLCAAKIGALETTMQV